MGRKENKVFHSIVLLALIGTVAEHPTRNLLVRRSYSQILLMNITYSGDETHSAKDRNHPRIIPIAKSFTFRKYIFVVSRDRISYNLMIFRFRFFYIATLCSEGQPEGQVDLTNPNIISQIYIRCEAG